jgi:hypothetical protein
MIDDIEVGYTEDKQNFSANAPKLRLSCGYAVLFGHPNAFGSSLIRCAVVRNTLGKTNRNYLWGVIKIK